MYMYYIEQSVHRHFAHYGIAGFYDGTIVLKICMEKPLLTIYFNFIVSEETIYLTNIYIRVDNGSHITFHSFILYSLQALKPISIHVYTIHISLYKYANGTEE